MSPLDHALNTPEFYKTLLDTGRDWIYLVDHDGRVIYCSASCEPITGYRSTEFTSSPGLLTDIVHPADRDAHANYLRETACTTIDYRIKTKKGATRWIRSDSDDLFSHEGINIGRRFTNRDITGRMAGRREREEHLQQTKHLQQIIQELNECSSLVEVAQKALSAIVNVLDAASSSLVLFEKDKKIQLQSGHKVSKPVQNILNNHCPWKSNKEKIHPVCYANIREMNINARKKRILSLQNIQSTMFIPLLHTHRFLGKFVISFNSLHACSEQQLNLSQVIAQNLTAIIARFQAMEEIRHAEQRYHSIVTHSAEGIYQSTPDGRFIMVNPAMVKMFGYKNEQEMLSIKNTRLLYWDESDRDRLTRASQGEGLLRNAEVKMRRANGQPIWVIMNGRAIKDDKGTILYHEGALLDITGRKIKEQQLWESEERYHLLSAATFEAIFISERGICTGQNKTAEKMFGHTQEEAIGRPGTEWVIPRDRDLVKKHMLSGYEKPYEVTALRKDGSTFPCEIQARMFDYRGKKVRMTALRDITDRKAAQTARTKSEERMQSLLRLARHLEQIRRYEELALPLKDEIKKIFGLNAAWIHLFSEDHRRLQLISSSSEIDADITGHIANLTIKGDPLLEEITRSREIICIRDAQTDPRTNKDFIKKINARTVICVPVLLANQRYGLISTGSFGAEGIRTLSGPDLKYLEAISKHIAVVIDRIRFISEARQTTEELSLLAEFNKNIVSSAPVGILTLNRDGQLTSANRAFLQMMGSPGLEETLKLGMNTIEVKQSGISRLFLKTLKSGKPFEIENLPYHSHWGKKLIVNVKGVPQKTESDEITGLILVVEDITKRHKTERQLIRLKELAEENENKFRAITNQSFEGITVTDTRGRYLFVNPAFCKMVGFSEKELMRMSIFDIKAGSQDPSPFKEASETGTPVQALLKRKDGSEFYSEIIRKRIDYNGKKCILGTIRDITEKKHSEEKLKKLSAAIEQSPVSVLITDYEGKVEYVNPRFIELTGYSKEEVLGKNPRMLQSGVMSEEEYREMWETILSGKEWRGEFHNRKKNGELYWEDAVISSITNDQGEITHFLAVKEDITDRKKAQEALKKSEENYRTVVDNVQEVIFRTDDQGVWTFLNPAWEEITGFSIEETLGTLFLAYVYPEDREENMERFRPLLERKKEKCFHVVRYLTRDGGYRWLEVQARLILDTDGQILGTAGTLTDITEKKQAEDALIESYEFNESLIRAIPFGMDIVDEKGNILFLSQNLKDQFGADATRKKCWELYCDDKNQCINCPLKHKIQVGKTEVIEVVNIMNGKVFQVNHTGMIYKGKKAILETFQDISGRKQAETALQQQLSFSRSLNQISENITGEENRQRIFDTITTIAGETLQLDLCLIYNISYHNARITGLSEWLNPENSSLRLSTRSFPLEQFRHSHKQLKKKKSWFISDVDAPNKFLVKEGSDLFLHKKMGIKSLLWHPLAMDNNGYFLLAFYHTDASHSWSKTELDFTVALARMTEITLMKMRFLEEQKSATAEISRLAAVVEQAGESIIITNLEGQIEYVNPAFEKITGYSAAESLGKNPRFLKSGTHDASFYRQLWSTIREGQVWSGKFIDRKKDGSLFTEDTIIFPVKNDRGKIINFCKIARDVSHEQELEEQLRQAQKMEAVGTLAGGVAHDFNNLLTVINGYADLALMKLEEGHPGLKDFEAIKVAGKKAASLTSQLLAFSRKQIHKPEVININQLVTDMEKILRRLITEDILMVTLFADNLPSTKADPNQLEQILTNLVINARDAVHVVNRPGYKKNITIETGYALLDETFVAQHPGAATGPHVFFSVSDNGIGMDETVKKRIFEPFFTTKSKYKGTGLGLAMVYGIVKQNKGFISLDSFPGQGTTFKIYWPVTEEKKVSHKKSLKEESLSGSESILIVEDDDEVRKFAINALSSLGYRVFEASNGRTALDLIKTKELEVDLIITDLIMPEMNGRELATHISSISADAHIIFVSGYTDDQIAFEGSLEEGINFIQKPYSIQTLAGEIRRVLNKK